MSGLAWGADVGRIETGGVAPASAQADVVSATTLGETERVPPSGLSVAPRTAEIRVGLGLNYPGAGVRLALGDAYMIEARGQYEPGVWAAGGRGYYCFAKFRRLALHAAVEVDYAHFSDDGFVAAGYAAGAFLAAEYYLLRRVALQLDFGPAWVALNGSLGTEKKAAAGMRLVTGFGLTYYFGDRGDR